MPSKPTPVRNFRIPDDIYMPAKAKAEAEGITVTDVVREALIAYVEEDED